MSTRKQNVLNELQQIPGVGRSISLDLWNLGIRSISELKNKDPEQMYAKHCRQRGMPVDRCLLYTFRCAVYFSSKKHHDPELLKWWNWKD